MSSYKCIIEILSISTLENTTVTRFITSSSESAAKQNHSEHDCMVISVLSHGRKDSLYAKDIEYKVEDFMYHFTPDFRPTLAGKPKIFFIQACQGNRYDPGVTLTSIEADGDLSTSYKIPLLADILIMYSTAKGFKAFRDPEKGSWFIQTLAQELEARAYESDLFTILTYVNQRVAIEYDSGVTGNPHNDAFKQIPCIVSMLTRFIKFTQKI